MSTETSTARLVHGPDNPLGEREIEVGLTAEGVELSPVIEVDGERHALRLVSFADGEGMPEYTYEHQVHDDGTAQGFSIPSGDPTEE